MRISWWGAIFVLVFVALGGPAGAEERSLAEALGGGKGGVGFLLRSELVDDDAFSKDAHALLLRSAVSYRTLAYRGLDFFIEATDVTAADDATYANAGAGSLGNGVAGRPVIADPELTEINQVHLRYRRQAITVVLGREEILHGDERFVGNVGWRLNHQSYEGLRVAYESLPRIQLEYAFLTRVHRVTGANQPMTSHLFRARVELGEAGALTGYGYFLDFDETRLRPLSTNTFGAELSGSRAAGAGKVLYEVELAHQRDAAGNPNRVRAEYLHAMLGGTLAGFTLQAAIERLEGSAADGQFNTTLGTNHKFNGWADKFLETPTDGLQDLYLSLGRKRGSLAWVAVYHDLRATGGDGRYGREVDLRVVYRAPWKQTFAGKAALYRADGFSSDATKAWLWTSYRF